MTKIYALGFAALFAVAASAVPAAAKDHHHGHHGHHGHHHGHGYGGGFGLGFGDIVVDFGGPVVYDDPDPIYCVGKHGKLYVCGWN